MNRITTIRSIVFIHRVLFTLDLIKLNKITIQRTVMSVRDQTMVIDGRDVPDKCFLCLQRNDIFFHSKP